MVPNRIVIGRQTHYEEYCYKNVEKYIPGYYNKHGQWVGGYVDSERKRVPCGRRYIPQTAPHYHYEEEHPNVGNVDNNSCVEGISIIGGILGGGALGAAASQKRWPLDLGNSLGVLSAVAAWSDVRLMEVEKGGRLKCPYSVEGRPDTTTREAKQ